MHLTNPSNSGNHSISMNKIYETKCTTVIQIIRMFITGNTYL